MKNELTLKQIIKLKKEAESKVDIVRREFYESTGLMIDGFESDDLGYSKAIIDIK